MRRLLSIENGLMPAHLNVFIGAVLVVVSFCTVPSPAQAHQRQISTTEWVVRISDQTHTNPTFWSQKSIPSGANSGAPDSFYANQIILWHNQLRAVFEKVQNERLYTFSYKINPFLLKRTFNVLKDDLEHSRS